MTKAIVFDTELSDRKNGEIIEAAWIMFRESEDLAGPSDRIPQDLSPAFEFRSHFKPSREISFGAMAIHHILPPQLEGCPPSSSFSLPADISYIIGHSIDVDWEAAGSPAHVKRIDTHCIAQWLWPDATGYSQGALLYMLAGANSSTRKILRDAHSALWDARINAEILEHILRLKPEITTWSQLWQYSEECRIPRTCPLKRWEGVPLADMDYDAIDWCLRQHWLDPYFRLGLERVLDARSPEEEQEDEEDEVEEWL